MEEVSPSATEIMNRYPRFKDMNIAVCLTDVMYNTSVLFNADIVY